jgi:hypothetical protein
MKCTIKELKNAINQVIQEIGIDKFKDVEKTSGSTHQMNVAKLIDDERNFFIKFSDISPDLWNEGDPDPSIQCMSEYLAYKIYALYPNVKIPSRIELVIDPKNKRVGIATAAVSGRAAKVYIKSKDLAKKIEAGIYVDIFMANWDVVGTGTGNLISSEEEVIRIDPGSSFHYRAQGARKGHRFNPKADELNTMLDPSFPGAGSIFQYANLKNSAKEFLNVSWETILQRINETQANVSSELKENKMFQLLKQWNSEVDSIKNILVKRHDIVSSHAKKMINAK